MATDNDPQLAATKTRILTHMTKDHADSLALFLNYYCRLPTPMNPPPPTIQLDEITLDHFIIAHPSGRNLIKFNPPMKSYAESRSRLVEMHNEALHGLGLAEFKVEKFVLPTKAWQWFTHAVCIVTWSTFIFWPADQFLPESGGLPSRVWSFGGLVPANARLAARVKDMVLLGMVVVHGLEAAWFAQTRLRKYWVPTFSSVWLMWVAAVFNGGVAGIWRFDEYVQGIREERKQSGKH